MIFEPFQSVKSSETVDSRVFLQTQSSNASLLFKVLDHIKVILTTSITRIQNLKRSINMVESVKPMA